MNKLSQIMAILKCHLGMSISAFMHLSLFILLLINFPQCQRKTPPEIVISLDLLPISTVSNVENKQSSQPEPKKEEKPEKPIEKVIEEPQPQKQEKPIEEKIPDPKPEVKPEPEKEKVIEKVVPKEKPKPKVPPKKEEKKKKVKPKLTEMEKLLKNMEDIVQKNDSQEDVVDKPSKGPHNSDMPLSLSVKDSIRRQVEQCWSPPAGNKDAAKLQILLRISLKQDGSVASVKIIDNISYNRDDSYRVAADAAVRAVHKASPLQGLPVDQYNIWQDLEFDFNPSGILGD